MIDLLDVTFMIPIKIESDDRKTNLSICVDYLLKHFNTNIILCEQDVAPKVPELFKDTWHGKCKHIFLPSDGKYFHKTRCLNVMIKQSTTPIVVSFDSDIILPLTQIVEARDLIAQKKCAFAYPFNQRLYHIEKPIIPVFQSTLELETIGSNTTQRHTDVPPGGAFFIDKATFYQCGLENEHFISWGPEDQERASRISKIGHEIKRVIGPIFHLDHIRTENSNHQHDQYERNIQEFNKINNMSRARLLQQIGKWTWTR